MEGRDERGRFLPGHSGNPKGGHAEGRRRGWERVLEHMEARLAGRSPGGELAKLSMVELARVAKTLRILGEQDDRQEAQGARGEAQVAEVNAGEAAGDERTKGTLRLIGELEAEGKL